MSQPPGSTRQNYQAGAQGGQLQTGQTIQQPTGQQMTQQPTGGQMGQQQIGQQQIGRAMGHQFEDFLTSEMRLALDDFVEAAEVCEWCADVCLDEGPQMATCVRLCRDVADLAALNVQFMSRDSIWGPELAELFAYAAQECAQECSQFQTEHCQECAAVLQRATDTVWRMLDSFQQPTGQVGQTGQMGQMGQMGQVGQPTQTQAPQSQF